MADLTLTQEQYEALLSLAQQGTYDADGAINQDRALVLDAALMAIEKANGLTRHSLWIQWQDPVAPLPPGVRFPETWPPELRYFLQFISRPISRGDVLSLVKSKTPKAVNILVTPDPAALVGWTPVNDYFVQP